jgi:hypothetical protein
MGPPAVVAALLAAVVLLAGALGHGFLIVGVGVRWKGR